MSLDNFIKQVENWQNIDANERSNHFAAQNLPRAIEMIKSMRHSLKWYADKDKWQPGGIFKYPSMYFSAEEALRRVEELARRYEDET